jgi:hypothetical protein
VLLSGGLSVKAVSVMLGHSNAAITLRVYAHILGDEDDRTRAILDAALDGLRTPRGLSDQENGVVAGQAGDA